MDDVTARTYTGTRRMASVGSSPARRASSGRTAAPKSRDQEVSPARWAGVALVIAAIASAILLAIVSPSGSEPRDEPAVLVVPASPSPSPSATGLDARPPTVKPTISRPADGEPTAEREIAVTVQLPAERVVPQKHLTLYIMLGGEITDYKVEKPKTGGSVVVQGIRIEPGDNLLQAVLASPAGPGPVSDPVTVSLDVDLPPLEIVSPPDGFETFEENVEVTVSSEIGAEVKIANVTNDWDQPPITITGNGQDSLLVPLKSGVANRIRATSVDRAGQRQKEVINVTRLDPKPVVKVKAPKAVKKLPERIAVNVKVTDSSGSKLEGATVHFALGGGGRTAEGETDVTNAEGRASWKVTIDPSTAIASDAVQVSVTVVSPVTGATTVTHHTVAVQ